MCTTAMSQTQAIILPGYHVLTPPHSPQALVFMKDKPWHTPGGLLRWRSKDHGHHQPLLFHLRKHPLCMAAFLRIQWASDWCLGSTGWQVEVTELHKHKEPVLLWGVSPERNQTWRVWGGKEKSRSDGSVSFSSAFHFLLSQLPPLLLGGRAPFHPSASIAYSSRCIQWHTLSAVLSWHTLEQF